MEPANNVTRPSRCMSTIAGAANICLGADGKLTSAASCSRRHWMIALAAKKAILKA
jgi:uncharacterized protein YdhG (YjbR/CyaY superfamily)